MRRKTRTIQDYNTIFQVTEIDKDKFVLLAALSRKQLESFMFVLHSQYVRSVTVDRGQYQALAKAIMHTYKGLEEKKLVGQRKRAALD